MAVAEPVQDLRTRLRPAAGAGRFPDPRPREIHGHPLVYLDNAASTQKPRAVVEAIADCYGGWYANVERGVHTLSQLATAAARAGARDRARASSTRPAPEEVVFTRGTTEGINLVAEAWGRRNVGPGDEVLITGLEHHSNLVPWQRLCEERGAALRVAPLDDRGEVRLDEFASLLSPRTRIAAFAHVSNALGTINPVREMAAMAHRAGAARAGGRRAGGAPPGGGRAGAGVRLLRLLRPQGLRPERHRRRSGGARELLAAMPPWQSGGGMVAHGHASRRPTYAPPPHRFEAGTPFIEGAAGLAAALDYLTALGLPAVAAWEGRAARPAPPSGWRRSPGCGSSARRARKAAVLSFTMEGIHPHDLGTILDHEGIAIRAGHHCAQPVMERFGVPATARASFGLYNTLEEVEALAAALRKARELFG